jgi:hypothetical protein
VTRFSDFHFASLMPVLAALFPATAQRGYQMIDGPRAGHFAARFAASVLTFAQYALVGSKRGTILESENHPAESRNEAIVTSALPKTSTILASLGQAAFVWDIVTDAMVWSDHLSSVFPDIPAESLASGAEFSKLIEPARGVRSDALGHSSPARGG